MSLAHPGRVLLSHRRYHQEHPPGHPDDTLWFHGSPRDVGTFAPLPPGTRRATFHWNAHLGTHFAHHPEVAHFFARGGHARQDGHGQVHARRLALHRPAFYPSEAHLAAAALHAAWTAGVLLSGDLLEYGRDEAFGPDHRTFEALFRECTGAWPDHERLGRHLATLTSSSAQSCPLLLATADRLLHLAGQAYYRCGRDQAEDDDLGEARQEQAGFDFAYRLYDDVAQALRVSLCAGGYDGVLYVNSVPPEFGLAALPFDPTQIVQGDL